MKTRLALCALALAGAGCASTEPMQLAQADCKVVPIVTTSAGYTGKTRPVSGIEQRYAQMQLASSQYRRDSYAQNGLFNNTVEEALRDCDTASK